MASFASLEEALVGEAEAWDRVIRTRETGRALLALGVNSPRLVDALAAWSLACADWGPAVRDAMDFAELL